MKDTAADATAALDVDKIAVLTRLLRLEVTAFSCRSAGRVCQNEIDRRIKQDLEQLYVNLVWMSPLKKLSLLDSGSCVSCGHWSQEKRQRYKLAYSSPRKK